MKPVIGIIGGTGGMGQLFARVFRKNGYKVLIASRRTKLKIEDLACKADVVIVTVPINSTIAVLKKIGPLVRKDALLMDLTSLKKEPVKAMLKYSKSAVIGTHPVFGPTVSSFKQQTFVLTPARPGKWLPWLKDFLRNEGAKIKITTAERHDRMMAVIQGLTHFSTLAVADSMKELGVDVKRSLEYSSPIYKLRMDMVGRILNQNPNLYADIEIANPEIMKTIKVYIRSAKKLEMIIKKKDRGAFIKYFKESADFFGDFKKEAAEFSDYLIEQLVKRK